MKYKNIAPRDNPPKYEVGQLAVTYDNTVFFIEEVRKTTASNKKLLRIDEQSAKVRCCGRKGRRVYHDINSYTYIFDGDRCSEHEIRGVGLPAIRERLKYLESELDLLSERVSQVANVLGYAEY
jgi:hypothetical protein